MQTFSCQSGSNGNCIFVQAGRTGILVDAGISGKQAQQRLTARGQDIRRADALLLSHDHVDHSSAAGILQRKFGLPIYCTPATLRACQHRLGSIDDVRLFQAGAPFQIGEAVIHPIPTPHDSADGVCFMIEHNGKRLGVLTDLGFAFAELEDILPDLDAAYLETNYDPQMLRDGPYSRDLQARIRGAGGHLANAEAATLLRNFTDRRLTWVALAHLSEHNNTPELALRTVSQIVGRPIALHLAGRYGPSQLLHV